MRLSLNSFSKRLSLKRTDCCLRLNLFEYVVFVAVVVYLFQRFLRHRQWRRRTAGAYVAASADMSTAAVASAAVAAAVVVVIVGVPVASAAAAAAAAVFVE